MKILNKFKIRKKIFRNRISVAPMCQYSADNGNPSNWHFSHLEKLSQSGAGVLMVESTAVSKEGRITKKDLTLINKKNENEFKKLVNYIKSSSDILLGIQISHAGRKGSAEVPWIKSNTPLSKKQGSWVTLAPSKIKRDIKWPLPKELSVKEIKKIRTQFKNCAIKAKKANFDILEIHMAHGYLLHQFFSPISNLRKDNYGGDLKKRCKLLIEITKDIKKIWPKQKVLGARVNGQDWLKNGSTIEDCVYLVKKLKQIGIDYVCVTSGGIIPKTNIKFKPGYQVHLAKTIKKRTGVVTRTTGMITSLNQSEKIIEKKSADLVNIGRKFVADPTWLLREFNKKKIKVKLPNQYLRCF